MMATPKNPIQPIVEGRFKKNKIVRELLDISQSNGYGLNEIACKEYSQDDRVQFAQLIGYSLSGFAELSYVDDDTYNAASLMYEAGVTELEARCQSLQEELDELRKSLREPMARLFGKHPDDLWEPSHE